MWAEGWKSSGCSETGSDSNSEYDEEWGDTVGVCVNTALAGLTLPACPMPLSVTMADQGS